MKAFRSLRTIFSIISWGFLIYYGLKKNVSADDVISAVVFGVIIVANKIDDISEDLDDVLENKNKDNA
jgi:hypothetical protein